MSTVLSQMPGQTATIVQQVLNQSGARADGYFFSGSGPLGDPVIERVILPNQTLATGFPVAMNRLDVGLYTYSFVLPSGAAAVGLYIVDVSWYHPDTHALQQDVILINVTAPFGLYSTTVSAGVL